MTKIAPQFSPSGTNSMLNFFTGALDLAYMGSSPLILGYLFNLPVKVVAIANRHKGSLVVLKSKTSNSHETKKVGTVFGSDGHVLAHHFMKSSKDKMVAVNLSPLECLEAIEIGMIDYAALWDPYASLLKNKGHEVVFCDTDLDFSMYSFIVSTENSLLKKRKAISDFVDIHNEAVELINSSELNKYMPSLRYIFGSELKEDFYHNIMKQGYEWPKSNLIKEGVVSDDVALSLEKVALTHQELKNGIDISFDINQLIPEKKDEADDDCSHIDVGYSNSIMCSSFHLADLSGLFSKHGMPLITSNRRMEERIARLDEEYRDDIKLCFELLPRDPELVLQKLGRMNEALFQKIEKSYYGDNRKSIAASIDRIRENNLVSNDILSWADSIRSIRNVATHSDNGINSDEARNAFNIFLNILEWFEKNESEIMGKKVCARCYKKLDASWKSCPYCGSNTSSSCSGCEQEVQPTWKICPFCSTKL